MEPVAVFPLAEVVVSHDPAEDGGTATTGSTAVTSLGDLEVGVWEMSAGSASDVEADEVFVLLSGRGVIELEDGSEFAIKPGDLVRLAAGTKTVWHVSEPLRKVYVIAA
ncbi:cupin [Actinoplanes sp. OR16]|uniref:cupin domain-containing protein n=1 Tax=Actinoplanes sp. OR16 TaxID=946334 RepID=UPI000F707BBE|nr:cupin domain-containing protein [Actinoplanes sp. OR16]BBH68853.1 cupin [Actinoplanes sp. OR16]